MSRPWIPRLWNRNGGHSEKACIVGVAVRKPKCAHVLPSSGVSCRVLRLRLQRTNVYTRRNDEEIYKVLMLHSSLVFGRRMTPAASIAAHNPDRSDVVEMRIEPPKDEKDTEPYESV